MKRAKTISSWQSIMCLALQGIPNLKMQLLFKHLSFERNYVSKVIFVSIFSYRYQSIPNAFWSWYILQFSKQVYMPYLIFS